MANNKHVFTDEGERKIANLATYSGMTWDQAAEEVLAVMHTGQGIDYALERVRDKARTLVKQSVVRERAKITSYRIPQAVLDVAMDLAQGDISRLRIDPTDGSITVVNASRKRDS